jgi:outer membrane lipoprotein carrier protein
VSLRRALSASGFPSARPTRSRCERVPGGRTPSVRGLLAALPLLAVLLAEPGAVRAEPCGAKEQTLLSRAQQAYQAVSGFQSAFAQEDIVPGAAALKASGTLAYRKPGRMRWEYAPPNEQLLVTDGTTVWLYDPLLESVTEQALKDVTEGTPLKFLLGAGSLTSDFECRTLTRPSEGKDGLTYLELVPHAPIPALAFIQLGVRADSARIEAFRMLDTQGGERWVRLSQFKTGANFPPDHFTFKVKPGMDVIKK